jgi:hypothetical protein
MRILLRGLMLSLLSGCANLIPTQEPSYGLVGLSEQKILACMGRPQGRFTVGATQVWQYNSGGVILGSADVRAKTAKGRAAPIASPPYCIVNIAMRNKAVQSVDYRDLSGTALEDEHCAPAIKACLSRK